MLRGYRPPVDTTAVAHNFEVFAEADCDGEPLYAALSRAIATDPARLALMMQAPSAQRRPVLLFAAVHDRLLASTAPRHALARFYRSIVDEADLRVDVEHAMPLFADFCGAHGEALARLLAQRATQTNEVGRCAGLRLALATLRPDRPIALVDIGCSAGLNLQVDRYRYEYLFADGTVAIAGAPADVVVRASVTDGAEALPRESVLPPIAQRIGIDRAPLDVGDAEDARWLRACVWPSDIERHERLAAAIVMARAMPSRLIAGDANDRAAAALESIDRTLRPVFFHSWVLSYLDPDARRRFADTARAMVVARDGVWIAAESPGMVPGLAPARLPDDAGLALREATVWHVTTRQDGRAATRLVARSHPHCRWIERLGRAEAPA